MRSLLRSRARGFTLIELLVVIAIIALLVGILLPALASARKAAKTTKELGALEQMLIAQHTYSSDRKEQIIPAGPHWDWVHVNPVTNPTKMIPNDPKNPTYSMEGTTCKTWVMHLICAGIIPLELAQIDNTTRAEFDSRDSTPLPSSAPNTVDYTGRSGGWHAAYAWHPSFGMNGIYVGGSYSHGAFRSPANGANGVMPGGNTRNSGGTFWLRKMGDAKFASKLVLLGASRGGDVKDGSYWGWGQTDPDSGTIRPGHWMIKPPAPAPWQRGSYDQAYALGTGWSTTARKFDPTKVPSTWGMLDGRNQGKALVGRIDGHGEVVDFDDLRDMTQWSNYATKPDSTFTPAP